MPSYKGQSPQLNLRQYFADLIAIVSNHFRLCPAARHLAVYLLDLFMDRYDLTVQQLHMVSLSCLLLASKCGADLTLQPVAVPSLHGVMFCSSLQANLRKGRTGCPSWRP